MIIWEHFRPHARTERGGALGDDELRVAELLVTGALNPAIAQALDMSEHEVLGHLERIGEATGARTRHTRAHSLLTAGLVAPPPRPGPAPVLSETEHLLLIALAISETWERTAEAAQLNLSTIKPATRALTARVGADNRTHLIGLAHAWHLFDLPTTPATPARPLQQERPVTHTTRPRTCGARVPMNDRWQGIVENVAAGHAGPIRLSLSCALAEHPGSLPHHALTMDLPDRAAVWARWAHPDDMRWQVRPTCPATTGCHLPSGHPLACTAEIDPVPRDDPGRLPRIRTAIDELARAPDDRDHDDTLATVLLLLDELHARRLWAHLPACDQAAAYMLLTSEEPPGRNDSLTFAIGDLVALVDLAEAPGDRRLPGGRDAARLHSVWRTLPPAWQDAVLTHDVSPSPPGPAGSGSGPGLARILADAAARAAASPGRTGPGIRIPAADPVAAAHRARLGTETRQRMDRLPPGWQVHVFRLGAAGMPVHRAVTRAVITLNVLPRYGIRRPEPGLPDTSRPADEPAAWTAGPWPKWSPL
ncbi:hypothetical protein GCM10010371_63820 [Streptomyces subrutilus]|uniref:Uncharacterized protein n=1 Tax=Streptomyces subrutilus TaxID=36818 RepID=A0A918RDN2_9ACTN|nr:hypothetical protein [Streptomyces subrutilus]GGZ95148.1 hypothetical protein GCM10010371_63820 [Streptomyces subrutilus]